MNYNLYSTIDLRCGLIYLLNSELRPVIIDSEPQHSVSMHFMFDTKIVDIAPSNYIVLVRKFELSVCYCGGFRL
jgi:hypothetical protein